MSSSKEPVGAAHGRDVTPNPVSSRVRKGAGEQRVRRGFGVD